MLLVSSLLRGWNDDHLCLTLIFFILLLSRFFYSFNSSLLLFPVSTLSAILSHSVSHSHSISFSLSLNRYLLSLIRFHSDHSNQSSTNLFHQSINTLTHLQYASKSLRTLRLQLLHFSHSRLRSERLAVSQFYRNPSCFYHPRTENYGIKLEYRLIISIP